MDRVESIRAALDLVKRSGGTVDVHGDRWRDRCAFLLQELDKLKNEKEEQ